MKVLIGRGRGEDKLVDIVGGEGEGRYMGEEEL